MKDNQQNISYKLEDYFDRNENYNNKNEIIVNDKEETKKKENNLNNNEQLNENNIIKKELSKAKKIIEKIDYLKLKNNEKLDINKKTKYE